MKSLGIASLLVLMVPLLAAVRAAAHARRCLHLGRRRLRDLPHSGD